MVASMKGSRWLCSAAVLLMAALMINGEDICPLNNWDKDIFFPHESNCSQFYECSWGKKELMECPDGLHFNSQINECDWPENVKCKNNTSVNRQVRSVAVVAKECPPENSLFDVLLPHESDCGKFYKCDRGNKVLQFCPEGLHFNANTSYCDWPWNSKCEESAFSDKLLQSTTEPSVQKIVLESHDTKINNHSANDERLCPLYSWGTLFPHKSNCSQFYQCYWGEKILLECRPGLHFNSEIGKCDKPEDAKCANITLEGIKGGECPLENPLVDILLSHESDCGKFYKCDRGIKVLQNCPEGLHFNAKVGYCDWPWNSACEENSLNQQIAESGTEGIPIFQSGNVSYANSTYSIRCPLEYNGKDVLLSHPSNCTKFLHCDHGQPVEKDCPAGLYFNNVTDRCDWPWNVQCKNSTAEVEATTTYPDLECPFINPDDDVLFPHENDCTKYYRCSWGTKVLESCPTGWHFNGTGGYCNWPVNSICDYNRNIIIDYSHCSTNASNNYIYPHEFDCQQFYTCVNGTATLFDCPQDLYFNPIVNTCEELEEIPCELPAR